MNILKPVIALLLLLFLAAAGCHRVSENPQVELPIIDIQTDKDIQWDAKHLVPSAMLKGMLHSL